MSLVAKWIVARWPGRGETTWSQAFFEGIEVGAPEAADAPADADIEIECTFPDFAAFLFGLRSFEEFHEGARITRGGIGVMSCLTGLVFARDALRLGSTDSFERRAIVDAFDWSDLEIVSDSHAT